MALDLAWWAKSREELEDLCERITAKAGRGEPVTKARNGHGSASLNRSLITGAARRRRWVAR